jgi:hypothetical protein
LLPFFRQRMHLGSRNSGWLLLAVLMTTMPLSNAHAKGYSSGGGRSYSSGSHSSGSSHSTSTHTSSSTHSSGGGSSAGRSSSGGSSKTFTSSSGKSYSSHSSQSGDSKGYSSGKSYSGSNGSKYSSSRETKSGNAPASEKSTKTYSSGSGKDYSSGASPAASGTKRSDSAPNSFSFDTAAARARKEEASKQDFNRYKEERQNANTRPVASDNRAYTGPPPPIQTTRTVTRTVYVPDSYTIRTRSARWGSVFTPYYYRPIVVYRDSYSSFFWWWLLDQSLDQRAYWAYHHRWDMDDARYQALLASDARLQTRISELEAQQVAQDPSFTPTGLDRDLMYNDQYVSRAYSNRPTTGGKIAFWIFAVPTALGACCFFIWIIWFKRWKTAT